MFERTIIAALTGLLALLVVSCGRREASPSASSEPAINPKAQPGNPPAADPQKTAASSVRPAFSKLEGKWARVDGEYMLAINKVEANGEMKASYFNPNPINVSKALAIQEGDQTKVFVELRDAGYPGCTYTLKFDPVSDQLFGQYFQAAQQATYDVTFERLKE